MEIKMLKYDMAQPSNIFHKVWCLARGNRERRKRRNFKGVGDVDRKF